MPHLPALTKKKKHKVAPRVTKPKVHQERVRFEVWEFPGGTVVKDLVLALL